MGYAEELQEHYEWEKSRDYIVHVQGTIINEEAKAKDAGNQKLVEILQEKFREARNLQNQMMERSVRKSIIENYFSMLDEIKQVVEANQ